MVIHRINIDADHVSLGTVAKSLSSRAKKDSVVSIVIYPGDDVPCSVGIRLRKKDGSDTVINLSSKSALTVAKGILANLPFVAEDEELVNVCKQWVKFADNI